MKKVGICGHLAKQEPTSSGQVIKTRITVEAAKEKLGEENVQTVDSQGGIKTVPRMLWQVLHLFARCENIVMMPAYKGVRFFTPVCALYQKFFHRKLHYIVIGGWLAGFLDEYPHLAVMLRKWNGIYVETSAMKAALEEKGFENVVVMPNYKPLHIVKPEEMKETAKEPYALCTFSRVMQEKGIEDAIDAVNAVNRKAGETVYTLTIYGKVEHGYEQRFAELQQEFPEYIHYGGLIPYEKSTEQIRECFALLFPTHLFKTEGVPGTIIDAYAAGVPVIASEWENFRDVVENGKTGIVYSAADTEALARILEECAQKPEMLNGMKQNCLQKAEEYLPQKALAPLWNRL